MRATFKLLNAYFWKTIYGPIISLIFPIILLAILGNIFRIEYVYPGIIALSFLFIGVMLLPLSIMELKQTSLFKYIGSSPVNPIRFSIVVIMFYIFMALLTTFVILSFTMIIFKSDVFVKNNFREGILGGVFGTFVGGFSFLASLIIHLLFVIAAGLLIATFSKTAQQALTISLVVIIPSMFLSGMIISVDIIAKSSFLNWLSRFVPFRYSTGNIVIASTPLEQIGDAFQRITLSQKQLLFNVVNSDGSVTINNPQTFVNKRINSLDDLAIIQKELGNNIYKSISDKALYDLTIKRILELHEDGSNNNVFDWIHDWSVRRVPQMESVQDFIKEYFSTYAANNSTSNNVDWTTLEPIAEQISKGEFGWLEIFMKQNQILYFKADRILNVLIPVVVSGIGLWHVFDHFKWSAR